MNFHSDDGMENNLLMFYIIKSPDITYGRTFAHAIMPIGMINYDYNEVSSSYGSPSRQSTENIFYVYDDGEVSSDI